MPFTYNTQVRSARMSCLLAAIDAGAASGYIELGTTNMAASLCKIYLSKPSFAISATGVMTMNDAPKSGVATGAGTAAAARICD